MENFTNNPIDTATLPKFEEVALTRLDPRYYKVMLLNIGFSYTLLTAVVIVLIYFIEELQAYWWIFLLAWIVIVAGTVVLSHVSFRNRGFAFRTHDAIYRKGAISITTTIIPYSRVQNVALHEGFIARRFGLAAVAIFTAGGIQSDIEIKGIEKEHAEKIKQLLMGKISDRDADEQH